MCTLQNIGCNVFTDCNTYYELLNEICTLMKWNTEVIITETIFGDKSPSTKLLVLYIHHSTSACMLFFPFYSHRFLRLSLLSLYFFCWTYMHLKYAFITYCMGCFSGLEWKTNWLCLWSHSIKLWNIPFFIALIKETAPLTLPYLPLQLPKQKIKLNE